MQKNRFRNIIEATLKEIAETRFSIEEFSHIPTFKGRVQYCDERLEKLGAGSSRIVYKIDDNKVLKIAKNNKGIAQNTKEADFGRNAYGVTTELYNTDTDNYTWVEMEMAYPVKKSEVKSLIGITFEELIGVICYMHDEYARPNEKLFNKYKYDPTLIKRIMEEQVYTEKNEFLYSLYTFLSDYQPKYIYDYCRINNWGKVIRDRKPTLVIVDDGYDEEVAKLYGRST